MHDNGIDRCDCRDGSHIFASFPEELGSKLELHADALQAFLDLLSTLVCLLQLQNI